MFDATPDAEGHWFQGVRDPEQASELKQRAGRSAPAGWTDEYVQFVVNQIRALRDCGNLLVVGTGGKPSDDTRRIAEQCQYALVLLRDDTPQDEERRWLELCQNANTTVLAVIRSDPNATATTIEMAPDSFLRGTVAKLERQDHTSIERSRPLIREVLRSIERELATGVAAFRAMGEYIEIR